VGWELGQPASAVGEISAFAIRSPAHKENGWSLLADAGMRQPCWLNSGFRGGAGFSSVPFRRARRIMADRSSCVAPGRSVDASALSAAGLTKESAFWMACRAHLFLCHLSVCARPYLGTIQDCSSRRLAASALLFCQSREGGPPFPVTRRSWPANGARLVSSRTLGGRPRESVRQRP